MRAGTGEAAPGAPLAWLLRQPPATRVAACRTLDDALAWAAELGLRGTLQDIEPAGAWTDGADAAEMEDFAQLQADVAHRAAHAKAPSYLGALKTALHWVALYRLRYPHRVLFLPLHEPDTHRDHALHNEQTLATLLAFMQQHGSLARGKRGSQTLGDTKSGVVSTIRAFRSLEARYDVGDPRFGLQLRMLGQNLRLSDAPRAERELSQGVRAMHLAQLHQQGQTLGTFDEALAHVSLQMCARGGEPGVRDQGKLEPHRAFVWTDIEWRTAAESQSTLPSVDLWWYPAKDGQVHHRKVPIPISRRHNGPRGADPDCPYDALWAHWDARLARLPLCPAGCTHAQCPRSRTAVFTTDAGKVVDTSYMAALGQRIATSVGLDTRGVGGKWARIGGSTDIMDALGPEEGRAVLRQRGRWQRDLGSIYARVSARRQLDASLAMNAARGRDMTARAGWAQPAWQV